MKKQILFTALAIASVTCINAQLNTVTVSTGAGYATQKWYSLENGEQGSQPKDNWDIAFEISGYSSAIFANTQKTNFALYKAPYNIASYAALDTVGISNWAILHNSDTTWNTGAFNRGANPVNANDLGWGIYDSNTHFVNGDSCYVVKLSATSYKKLKITSLVSGVYTFVYADINGANSFTQTLSKSAYTGKNLAYFNLTTNAAIDREPLSQAWDFTFTKYNAFIPTPYGVTGIMTNKGVKVAQLNNLANPQTYSIWYGQNYAQNITTIGHDWKTFDLANNAWKIVNDTVYFVQDKAGNIWKLRFTGFGGSTTGDFIFTKEKISTVSLSELKNDNLSSLSLYPNPSTDNEVNVLYTVDGNGVGLVLKVYDYSGKEVYSESLNTTKGFYNLKLNTSDYPKGIYLLNLYSGEQCISQKLIKN